MLSLVISSSFSCSEAFFFISFLPRDSNKLISDLNLPSLSCFGDCMSGNDDVLAVDDTDTRSPVTQTRKTILQWYTILKKLIHFCCKNQVNATKYTCYER